MEGQKDSDLRLRVLKLFDENVWNKLAAKIWRRCRRVEDVEDLKQDLYVLLLCIADDERWNCLFASKKEEELIKWIWVVCANKVSSKLVKRKEVLLDDYNKEGTAIVSEYCRKKASGIFNDLAIRFSELRLTEKELLVFEGIVKESKRGADFVKEGLDFSEIYNYIIPSLRKKLSVVV